MRTIYQRLNFIPTAVSFSQLGSQFEDDSEEFDPMDSLQLYREETHDALDLEILLMQMMNELNDREKIVFLLQIMRSDGYRIDHASCSRALHITLRTYMNVLKRVRTKVALMYKASRASEK
jgi:DNA-directed RNA polymerase specialized sigma24 family protein